MPTLGFFSHEGEKWGISQAMLIADLVENILGCNLDKMVPIYNDVKSLQCGHIYCIYKHHS